jgi:hypothetical protein
VALLLGVVAAWRAFDLDLMQLLGVVLVFLFIGTVDQVTFLHSSPKTFHISFVDSSILVLCVNSFSADWHERR